MKDKNKELKSKIKYFWGLSILREIVRIRMQYSKGDSDIVRISIQ